MCVCVCVSARAHARARVCVFGVCYTSMRAYMIAYVWLQTCGGYLCACSGAKQIGVPSTIYHSKSLLYGGSVSH